MWGEKIRAFLFVLFRLVCGLGNWRRSLSLYLHEATSASKNNELFTVPLYVHSLSSRPFKYVVLSLLEGTSCHLVFFSRFLIRLGLFFTDSHVLFCRGETKASSEIKIGCE